MSKRETGYWWEMSRVSGARNIDRKAEEKDLERSQRRVALDGEGVHREMDTIGIVKVLLLG